MLKYLPTVENLTKLIDISFLSSLAPFFFFIQRDPEYMCTVRYCHLTSTYIVCTFVYWNTYYVITLSVLDRDKYL